jgi:hypothetical protein
MTNPSLDWQFPFQGRFAGKCRSEDPSEANARSGLTEQLKERHADLL